MLTSQVDGNGGAACLFLLFWCESICYPVVSFFARRSLSECTQCAASDFFASHVGTGPVRKGWWSRDCDGCVSNPHTRARSHQLSPSNAGVSGGAWFPSVQATLADHKTTQLSYVVAAAGYIAVAACGFDVSSWLPSLTRFTLEQTDSDSGWTRAGKLELNIPIHPKRTSHTHSIAGRTGSTSARSASKRTRRCTRSWRTGRRSTSSPEKERLSTTRIRLG